jgi:RNA polymerase sigma-70 factor (ECF subfamily)
MDGERMYSMLYQPIYRYVYWRVRNHEIAEDLTHDVFLKIYASKPMFESPEHERRVLFVSARNRLIDHFRKRTDEVLDERVAENIPDLEESSSTDRQAITREEREVVLRLLARLPEESYSVVVWKFIERKETSEIATLLGKSEDAVRQIQSRALRTLRVYAHDTEDGSTA